MKPKGNKGKENDIKPASSKLKSNTTNNQLQLRKYPKLGFTIPSKMPRLGIFKKKAKKPEQLEVVAAKRTDPTVQFNDGISVITPLTGLPPEDQPSRLRHLGMSPPQVNGANSLYDISCQSNDEMSAITSGVPSPEKTPRIGTGNSVKFGNVTEIGVKRTINHPTLPGYDDESEDMMVFEDTGSNTSPRSAESPVHITGGLSNSSRVLIDENTRRASEQKLRDTVQKNSSWLTRSKYFEQAVQASFDMVDADNSGDITLDEMYAGLLLIHLKLAVYVGAPACRVRCIGCCILLMQ